MLTPTTPPPIITGPGSYRTREGRRVEVVSFNPASLHYDSIYVWRIASEAPSSSSIYPASGVLFPGSVNPTDIIGPWPAPTRLSLAKAALDAAKLKRQRCQEATEDADRAVNARAWEFIHAEKEATQLAAIPPALLEVARSVPNAGITCTPEWVLGMLARSHSVDPAVLRAAMGAGK